MTKLIHHYNIIPTTPVKVASIHTALYYYHENPLTFRQQEAATQKVEFFSKASGGVKSVS